LNFDFGGLKSRGAMFKKKKRNEMFWRIKKKLK